MITVPDDLDAYGHALTERLLTPAECHEIAARYDRPTHCPRHD